MPYSLIGEDDNVFHVQHEDGSKFPVAKKGLSKKTLEKIQAMKPKQMADGGEVTLEDLQQQMSSPYQSPADAFVQQVQPQALPQALPPVIEPTIVQAPPVEQVPVEVTPAPVADRSPASAKPVVSDQTGLTGSLKNIYDLESQGIKGQASALAQQSQEQAKALENHLAQQQQQEAVYQQKYQDLDKEINSIYEQTKSGQIDPNRFWSNGSSGNRVMASIAVALGALGSAITGGRNDALEVINNHINRDIDAQKADLGHKNNLLSYNLQRYGNLQQAEAATRLQQGAALQAQMQLAAARSGSPAAMAKAKQDSAELLMKMMPLQTQLAQQQALKELSSGGSSGGSANAANLEALPDEARKRVVKLPNGQYRLAGTEKDADQLKEVVTSLDSLESAVDEAIDFAKNPPALTDMGALGFGSDAYKKSVALQEKILQRIGSLADLTKMPPKMAERAKALAPRPGERNIPVLSMMFPSIFGGATTEGSYELLKSLKKDIADKRNIEYSTKLPGVDRIQFKKRE